MQSIHLALPRSLRLALRSLRRSPVFATAAIVSLGLALAANITMFALIDTARHPYQPYPLGPATVHWIFPASAAIVLGLACANLGAMMLVRGLARRRDTAIRLAMGATRRSVVIPVLVECGVIVVAGAALGALLSLLAMRMLPPLLASHVPMIGELHPHANGRVVGFVLALSTAALVLAAVVPALRAASVDPSEPLRGGGAALTMSGRGRRHPLFVVEVVLAMALLVSCALFGLVAFRLESFRFSFPARRIVLARVAVPPGAVPDDATRRRLFDDVLDRARRLPGARLAAYRELVRPVGAIVSAGGGPEGTRWANLRRYAVVGPEYLAIFGVRILSGRGFLAEDRIAGQRVAVIDETTARLLWPDLASPVGRMLKLGHERSAAPWVRVVGVAERVQLEPTSDEASAEPWIYVSDPHDHSGNRDLVVLTDGAGGDHGRASFMLALQRELESLAPSLAPMTRVHPWLADVDEARAAARFAAWLFGAFASFALVLCAAGLHGVLAYAVRLRVRELALRTALGAPRRALLRVIVGEVAVTFLAGIAVGAFVALVLARPLSAGVGVSGTTSVQALLLAELALLAATTAAALAPIRHAMRADPAKLLRAS